MNTKVNESSTHHLVILELRLAKLGGEFEMRLRKKCRTGYVGFQVLSNLFVDYEQTVYFGNANAIAKAMRQYRELIHSLGIGLGNGYTYRSK